MSISFRQQLEQDLRRDEGIRNRPYRDTRGVLTVGVGHNLSKPLSDAAIQQIFSDDIEEVVSDLDIHLPWWRQHPPDVQRVLANLAFNMGIGTLLAFRRTLGFIQIKQYAEAADELMRSNYALQVGKRAERLAEILRNVL